MKRPRSAAKKSSSHRLKSKQQLEPLREVEQRWQLFFENAPVYCYMIAPKGLILDVNKAALTVLGYTKDELIGRSLNTIYAPEHQTRMKELLSKWKKVGELRDEELTIITKDGERREVLLSANAVDDPDGTHLYSISIQIDTTEYKKMQDTLKQSEIKLKDSEKRFRSIFENVTIGLAHVDLDGNIFECNHHLGEMLGYTTDELKGMNISEFTHPEDWEIEKQLDQDIIEGTRDSYEIEKRFYHKSGAIVWGRLQVTVTRDENGVPEFIIGMVGDVTDKLEEEKRYITLFETMAQGVVYQDSEGKIISANPAAEWILGMTFAQMTGRESVDPRWRSIREDSSPFPGEEHPAMVALRTGKSVMNEIMGIFNPLVDDYRWISVNAVPLFRPGEETPYQVYTTFNDITQRVRDEVQRTQQQGELELYASLLQHDLGNDLQVILGNVEVAEMLMTGGNGEVSKRLASIRAASDRMVNLLKALESDSDFEEGTLAEMLRRAAETAQVVHRGLKVNVSVSEEAESIALPRYRLLGIVCENLLRNAAEHAGAESEVEVSAASSGTNAVIEITDNGPGVQEDLRPKLFHRGNSSNGGGLGLYLSRQLLSVYNGTIELLPSRKGEGARFLITIPIRT